MKYVFNALLISALLCSGSASQVLAADKPIALDSRIKTYIYSENEVFKIVVNYGYQTSIEFAEDEMIQTISAGNSYAWQLTPVGKRLFIKPLEENILTNLTILTNKRAYHFEIQSKSQTNSIDEELVYVIRFFFPEENFDLNRIAIDNNKSTPQTNELLPVAKPFNFSYTLDKPNLPCAPVKVFDDGINTFFKFPTSVSSVPKFEISSSYGSSEVLIPRRKGSYIVLNRVAPEFTLSFNDNHIIHVINESFGESE